MRQSASGVRSAGRTLNFPTAKGRISESGNLKCRRESFRGNKSTREYCRMENVLCAAAADYELFLIEFEEKIVLNLL